MEDGDAQGVCIEVGPELLVAAAVKAQHCLLQGVTDWMLKGARQRVTKEQPAFGGRAARKTMQ